jgi:putative resolvase
MQYVKLNKAVEATGLCAATLRKYAEEGKIEAKKTPYGNWLFNCESFLTSHEINRFILYARVSSAKQRDDLDSQIAYLAALYPEAEIIKDIGSGLNYKRKGLKSILEQSSSGNKFTLVVAHKDRLARFGTELIEHMLNINGCKLLVLNNNIQKSNPQRELTEDLLAIIHIFSCRLYGQRRYSNNKKQEDTSIPKSDTEGNIEELVRNLKTNLQQNN